MGPSLPNLRSTLRRAGLLRRWYLLCHTPLCWPVTRYSTCEMARIEHNCLARLGVVHCRPEIISVGTSPEHVRSKLGRGRLLASTFGHGAGVGGPDPTQRVRPGPRHTASSAQIRRDLWLTKLRTGNGRPRRLIPHTRPSDLPPQTHPIRQHQLRRRIPGRNLEGELTGSRLFRRCLVTPDHAEKTRTATSTPELNREIKPSYMGFREVLLLAIV